MQITRLKRILVLGLLAPGLAHALGLGDITVRSYLNEPLKAEIPLRVDGATEVDDLRLRVASQAYFDRFGIVRSTLHDRMRFEIDERERVWVIRVSSREVVSEPYLSFPLEALWRGGELIREYTLFIDPRPQPRAAEVEGSPVRPTQPQTVPPPPTRVAAGASYGPVKRGETLWPIAKRLQPRGVSTEQMMMALLRANPTAFRAGNVNNLRAGAVLQVPSADEINRRSRRQARQAFRQQTAAWRGGGRRTAYKTVHANDVRAGGRRTCACATA